VTTTVIQIAVQATALLIIGAISLQATFMLVASVRRSRADNHIRAKILERLGAQIAIKQAELVKVNESVGPWNGWRKFKVIKRVPECDGICSFYLAAHDGKRLPPFKPGQFLTFQLNIPDQDRPVIRCYSLSDAPLPNRYRVSIKRVAPPRDKPDAPPGLSSNFFHDHVQVGDILDVRAPGGQFFLDLEDESAVVLIGGGVGITPVVSMLNALVEQPVSRTVWFFLGVRNSKDHPMKAHLEQLAQKHEKINMHICYSGPLETDIEGRDYHHRARVTVSLFKRLLPSNNFHYYYCGPPPMMKSLTKDLEEWGVPSKQINYEAFTPDTVGAVKKPAKPADASDATAAAIEVQFSKSNKTCAWDTGAGSLLEFAEAQGITMSSGCRAGSCGSCMTAIKKGDVDYNTNPSFSVESGSCLTCISVPKANLVLDA